MVCRVAATGAEATPAMLRHSDDLNPDDSALHLPLVQCRECRVTGWGAVQRAAASQAGRDLRECRCKSSARAKRKWIATGPNSPKAANPANAAG